MFTDSIKIKNVSVEYSNAEKHTYKGKELEQLTVINDKYVRVRIRIKIKPNQTVN